MTKQLPPEETRFKPGVSGNPSGRPQVPKEIQEARKISQFEFERIVNRYLFISPVEIKEDLERKDATAFEHLIGGIIEKAIRRKDEKKAEWLLARTLGKMRERLEVESKSLKVNVQTTAALPTLEQLALENPDLTPAQLSSFVEKVERLKSEMKAAGKFAETLALEAPFTEPLSEESLSKEPLLDV